MYVRPNYASKKLLKDAVKSGDIVEACFTSPGQRTIQNGIVSVEGPVEGSHYLPSWYAQVKVEGGRVVKVIS